MEEDGAKPMGMYCWDWGKMLAEWEQIGSSLQASEQQVRIVRLCLTFQPLKVNLLLTHPQIIPYSMFFQPACGNRALPL